ncbi:hypothetical protein D7Z26_23340 [Cohnella endophytica]|uniref:HAD family hydrolase n=1 Tax=Cohnella endophytica TaxID=2419778 RepID=A0A494X961_9BACL|nr:hypothetical protein [Cohnella endophytica]RKP47245.1 hypothetical protein D7Z26_23340 [Cohnella endophytica]
MVDEKQYVIETFRTHFGSFKDKRIVIYGIGPNTQIIVESFTELNIIGLMDEARAGEFLLGKPILTPEEVVERRADLIVIVARSNNVRIIYRRISTLCSQHAIRVYDLLGSLLQTNHNSTKTFDSYRDVSEAGLKAKIERADVVSFDVFDTLVMRRTLYPQDIFYVMEEKIIRSTTEPYAFAKSRIIAERELCAEDRNPKLNEIYDRLQQKLGLSEAMKRDWLELEIKTESEYLIRRENMCGVYQFALSLGKEVYFVSDMYLPEATLRTLLKGLGIYVKPGHLLVSCEYGVSKGNGLFEILHAKVNSNKIIHIGDNYEADERAARLHKIAETFHLQSALKMLEDSYASELLEHTNKLIDRLVIGEFIARELNDPFLFNETEGKFRIARNYDMAFSYFAPLVYCFLRWMLRTANEMQLNHILYSARDGYLLEEISRLLRGRIPHFPTTHYFYTSRATAVLAGLQNDEDIKFASGLAYSGSTRDMLKDRFCLTEGDIQERGEESDMDYLLRHREAILEQGRQARKKYKRYLDKLPVKPGERVGFFDFVSSGTCQKALSNFVDFELIGLYFSHVRSGSGYKSQIPIKAMYTVHNVYEKQWKFMDNYFLMENVLTSSEATLSAFDEDGQPIFSSEHRTKRQLHHLQVMHQAIKDYMGQANWDFTLEQEIDLAIPDLIFQLLKGQYSHMQSDYFDSEKLVDEFSNRTFELREQ